MHLSFSQKTESFKNKSIINELIFTAHTSIPYGSNVCVVAPISNHLISTIHYARDSRRLKYKERSAGTPLWPRGTAGTEVRRRRHRVGGEWERGYPPPHLTAGAPWAPQVGSGVKPQPNTIFVIYMKVKVAYGCIYFYNFHSLKNFNRLDCSKRQLASCSTLFHFGLCLLLKCWYSLVLLSEVLLHRTGTL